MHCKVHCRRKKVFRVSSKLRLRRFVLTDWFEVVLYKCDMEAKWSLLVGPDLFQLWSNCLDISFLCLYLSPFVFFAQPGCPGSAYLLMVCSSGRPVSTPAQSRRNWAMAAAATKSPRSFRFFPGTLSPPSVRPRTLVQPFTSKRVAKVQFWHVRLIVSCLPLLWTSCWFPVQHDGSGPVAQSDIQTR